MTREERENALHCLKVMIGEEVCEECNLYGTTGTDHCEADCVRVAIEALEQGFILDKIRAEIEQTAKDYDKFDDYRRVRGLWIALDIIDKYRQEG